MLSILTIFPDQASSFQYFFHGMKQNRHIFNGFEKIIPCSQTQSFNGIGNNSCSGNNNERCFPVINGKLEGVITTSDVVFELYKFMEFVEKHQSTIARNLPVNEAMNQNPETVLLGEDMGIVKETMVEDNLSTLIVVNDAEDVVGLISKDEMIQGLIPKYT